MPTEKLPPKDYQIDVSNGKYLFVMLSPEGCDYCKNDEKIRRKYAKAGLYLKGSEKPIWTVDWHARKVHIDVTGRFLVREGPWAEATQQLAVAFYDHGKLIKQYLIHDLIKDTKKLSHTVSHFFWSKKIIFEEKLKQLKIVTMDNQKYIFDITTGNIVSQEFLKEKKNAA